MVGGAEGTPEGSFLMEIGNPVYRNHFHRTWFGERYMKIYVDDEMALAEGRYTPDFLNEMKAKLAMTGCTAASSLTPARYCRTATVDW
jgi:hypothetical protein